MGLNGGMSNEGCIFEATPFANFSTQEYNYYKNKFLREIV